MARVLTASGNAANVAQEAICNNRAMGALLTMLGSWDMSVQLAAVRALAKISWLVSLCDCIATWTFIWIVNSVLSAPTGYYSKVSIYQLQLLGVFCAGDGSRAATYQSLRCVGISRSSEGHSGYPEFDRNVGVSRGAYPLHCCQGASCYL